MLRLLAPVLCVLSLAGRPLPSFDINLDLAPELRFKAVLTTYNATIWAFYQKLFVEQPEVQKFVHDLVKKRGPENAEMQAEIQGVANVMAMSVEAAGALQLLYELQTLMVPIENVTSPYPIFPWRGPGCTGIIAMDKTGAVRHARNMDFSPKFLMQNLTYQARFLRNGTEVFRAQMIAAYSCIVTGMRMGTNGFTIETNTRYTSHVGGNQEMFHHLLVDKRDLNGWTLRKVLETSADYEAALTAVSVTPLVATQYVIMSGNRKGNIVSRDPNGVANLMTLGQPNFECRSDYIIVTNFDYFFHDFREYFDYTGEIGHPRRIEAQKLLNASSDLTQDVLFHTISAKGVFATDTIFQAIMSVELNLWNVSLPNLD
jgi:hypothetical protein